MALNMNENNGRAVKNESIDRQLRICPGFKGQFRVSRKRLREIGRKGFEQIERLNLGDLGIFTE
jgi:hypothetical protein